MSRAIFAAPMTVPEESLIGETDSEIGTVSPFFLTRTVSKCSTRSPLRILARIAPMSWWPGGIRIETGLPMTSGAV